MRLFAFPKRSQASFFERVLGQWLDVGRWFLLKTQQNASPVFLGIGASRVLFGRSFDWSNARLITFHSGQVSKNKLSSRRLPRDTSAASSLSPRKFACVCVCSTWGPGSLSVSAVSTPRERTTRIDFEQPRPLEELDSTYEQILLRCVAELSRETLLRENRCQNHMVSPVSPKRAMPAGNWQNHPSAVVSKHVAQLATSWTTCQTALARPFQFALLVANQAFPEA